MNRYLTVPLILICFISFFGLIGIGNTYASLGSISLNTNAAVGGVEACYYDYGGNPVVFYNLTGVQGSGKILTGYSSRGVLDPVGVYDVWVNFNYNDSDPNLENSYAFWFNGSSVQGGNTVGIVGYRHVFALYLDTLHASPVIFKYISAGGYDISSYNGISFTSAVSLLILITFIMALGTLAGVKLLGSGVSDTSVDVLVKGSAYLALWAVFSTVALGLLSVVPMNFGYMFYFVLTFVYTVGVVDSFGHPSGGD